MAARKSTSVAARLDTHEAVCAERYAGIIGRFEGMHKLIGRIEKVLITVAATMIVGLLGALCTVLVRWVLK